MANNGGPHHLWRNDGGRAGGHFLAVAVAGDAPNTMAVGATVYVTAAGRVQRRDLRAGSNYASQDPLEAHFGLGDATQIDRVRVVWPDGRQASLDHVAADQRLVVSPAAPRPSRSSDGGCG